MSLGKTVKIGYQWKRISLAEEERQRIMQALVEVNAQEFKRCLETAKNISKEDYFNIAVVLFDKQGIAAYTALTEALEIKIHRLKNEGKPPEEEEKIEKEAEKKAEEAMKEPPAPPAPERTPLDKTYEKVQGTQSDLKAVKEQVGEPPKEAPATPIPTPPAPERPEAVDIEDKPEVTTEGGVTYETREIDLPEPDKQTKAESKEAADEVFGKEWDAEQGKLVSRKKEPAPSHPDAFKEVK